MKSVNRYISAFSKLGTILLQLCSVRDGLQKTSDGKVFDEVIKNASLQNKWFTPSSIRYAITAIAHQLNETTLKNWLKPYANQLESNIHTPLNIGVIMAGNIPLTGFHDFLCVMISGNTFVGKLSADDKYLLPFIANKLSEIDPELFKERIFFVDDFRVETRHAWSLHAVIATGSDNTTHYFEYYFGKYPHIIRKNRNAAAVLNGNETTEQLEALGADIFMYFGLGCRNVSKLFVPEGYDFKKFYESVYLYKDVIINNKYANNYTYHRALFLMDSVKFYDNGFLLLREDSSMSSPPGVLYYEYYKDGKQVIAKLLEQKEKLQCVVSENEQVNSAMKDKIPVVGFGKAQQPGLGDYADGVDTMEFLLGLK